MKLVIRGKRILIVLVCLLAVTAAAVIGFQAVQAVQTSGAKRLIPIYNVKTDEKKIAISFDAAWGNEQTQTLIDILGQYNVKATFFLVGAWVDKYPDSVKALAAAGHEIGNHSDTHPHMTKLSASEITKQITNCNEKVKALIGVSPVVFRPPYGDYDNSVVSAVTGLNMYCIQWDVDSLDWKDPTPDQIADRVISKVQPGSIILMHNGAKNTPEALPAILKTLQSQGYEFVPVSQLIYHDNYTINSAGVQISSAGKSNASGSADNTASVNPASSAADNANNAANAPAPSSAAGNAASAASSAASSSPENAGNAASANPAG